MEGVVLSCEHEVFVTSCAICVELALFLVSFLAVDISSVKCDLGRISPVEVQFSSRLLDVVGCMLYITSLCRDWEVILSTLRFLGLDRSSVLCFTSKN